MTLANQITIVRLVLVPIFLVELMYYVNTGNWWHYLAALAVFGSAAVSDGIDGYIARHYHQHSELGAFLDPLADKLLLVFGLVFLSLDHEPYFDRIPLWLVGTVFVRDFTILIGVVVIVYTCGKIDVKPHFIGKLATVLQMVTVSWTLLKWNRQFMLYLALGAAVCTAISFIIYFRDAIQQLATSPTSYPSPPRNPPRKKP